MNCINKEAFGWAKIGRKVASEGAKSDFRHVGQLSYFQLIIKIKKWRENILTTRDITSQNLFETTLQPYY